MTRVLKVFLIVVAVLMGCAVPGFTQDGPPPAEKRFLIVVDISESMKKTAVAAQKAIEELLVTGMHGQLRDEDTLGVWTYNDQLHTDFQMQVWSEADKKAIINKTMSYLRLQRYRKKSRFERAMPAMLSVIKSSPCLTVVWVSDGSGKILGTRFDREINGLHGDFKKSLQDSGLPFVTVMAARAGDLFDYSVSSSIGPIRVPETVEAPKTPSSAKTNKIVQSAPAPVVPVKPRESIRVVIGPSKTNSVPNAPTIVTQVVVAPAAVSATPPPVQSSNIPPTAFPAQPVVVSTNASPAAVAPVPEQASVTPETPEVENTNVVTEPATAPAEDLAKNETQTNPETVKPVEKSSPAPIYRTPAQPLQANDLGNSYYSKLLLVISCIFLMLAVGMVVFLILYLRRNRRHPSIISQSIKRQEKDSSH